MINRFDDSDREEEDEEEEEDPVIRERGKYCSFSSISRTFRDFLLFHCGSRWISLKENDYVFS